MFVFLFLRRDGAVLVTHYVARHDGLEIARAEDLGRVPAFAREHLRRPVTSPPPDTRLLTAAGEHVIHVRAVRPDGGRLTTPVIVSACFRRLEEPDGPVLPPSPGE